MTRWSEGTTSTAISFLLQVIRSSSPSSLQRAEHPLRLVQGLLILGLGHRVRDDAAADVEGEALVGDHHGPDGDVQVGLPVPAQIADGAGIDAPPRGLQLLDDLHRAHFWRSGNGAASKA